MSDQGRYSSINDEAGLTVQLYEGDVFVGVLAATHLETMGYPDLAYPAINKGDTLRYAGPNGIVEPRCVPDWMAGDAMRLEVLGFALNHHGHIANIADVPLIDPARWRGPIVAGRLLLVVGTSPECGKTTLVCQYGRAIKRLSPATTIAAIKATGTGGVADKQAFLDAGFDLATDFCDAGLATTHAIPADRFIAAFEALINYCETHADVVIVELGSTMDDQSVSLALRRNSRHGFPGIAVVNDQAEALEAIRRLEELEIPVLAIRYANSTAPAGTLERPAIKIIDPLNKTHMNLAAMDLLRFQRPLRTW